MVNICDRNQGTSTFGYLFIGIGQSFLVPSKHICFDRKSQIISSQVLNNISTLFYAAKV